MSSWCSRRFSARCLLPVKRLQSASVRKRKCGTRIFYYLSKCRIAPSTYGSFTPLVFIYPPVILVNTDIKQGTAGFYYQCSRTGCINEESFLLGLETLLNAVGHNGSKAPSSLNITRKAELISEECYSTGTSFSYLENFYLQ